ncbi:MAG: hypothetical protein WCO26_01240 [Deltaproteobacteria bacterium]
MAIPSLPVSIADMTKMHEDGDITSLLFCWMSFGGAGGFLLSGAAYYIFNWLPFVWIGFICFAVAIISYVSVLVYRPIFLSDEKRREKGVDRIRRRKYKALYKLEVLDAEEAMGKLTSEELKEYIDYCANKSARHLWNLIKRGK